MTAKVKICAGMNSKDIENQVNEFIKNKCVIDIKYQPIHIPNTGVNDRVLIFYSEDDLSEEDEYLDTEDRLIAKQIIFNELGDEAYADLVDGTRVKVYEIYSISKDEAHVVYKTEDGRIVYRAPDCAIIHLDC